MYINHSKQYILTSIQMASFQDPWFSTQYLNDIRTLLLNRHQGWKEQVLWAILHGDNTRFQELMKQKHMPERRVLMTVLDNEFVYMTLAQFAQEMALHPYVHGANGNAIYKFVEPWI